MLIRLDGTNPTWISPVAAYKNSPLPVNIQAFVNLIGQSQQEEFTFFGRDQREIKKRSGRRRISFGYIYVAVGFFFFILLCTLFATCFVPDILLV